MQITYRQVDAEQKVRDYIRELVGKENADNVRDQLPDGWSPRKGAIITVQGDGTPTSQTGWTEEIVRVSVHGDERPSVRRIMQDIDMSMQGHHLKMRGVQVTTSMGLLVSPSSLRGGYVASISYRVKYQRVRVPVINN